MPVPMMLDSVIVHNVSDPQPLQSGDLIMEGNQSARSMAFKEWYGKRLLYLTFATGNSVEYSTEELRRS